jgi:hypothetical protein
VRVQPPLVMRRLLEVRVWTMAPSTGSGHAHHLQPGRAGGGDEGGTRGGDAGEQ